MKRLRTYLPPNEVDCVVYHSRCGDGFGGAYTFWRYLKENGVNVGTSATTLACNDDDDERGDVLFIPYSHLNDASYVRQNIIPHLKDRNVVYVDVCPKDELFEEMLQTPTRAIVLDHHESALKTTEKFNKEFVFERCHIDQTHSGAIIAWQYCYPTTETPTFLQYIEDRDIWKWSYEEQSRPFTDALYGSIPYEFEAYSAFEDIDNVQKLIQEGKTLEKYKAIDVAISSQKALESMVTIDGTDYAVYIINTTNHISDLGHELASKRCERLGRECDFAMLWYHDSIRDQIKISLRSDSDRENPVNVSEIARYFGGGGHKCASGFTISNSGWFLDTLNNALSIDNCEKKEIQIARHRREINDSTEEKKTLKESLKTRVQDIIRNPLPTLMLGCSIGLSIGVGYFIGKHS